VQGVPTTANRLLADRVPDLEVPGTQGSVVANSLEITRVRDKNSMALPMLLKCVREVFWGWRHVHILQCPDLQVESDASEGSVTKARQSHTH